MKFKDYLKEYTVTKSISSSDFLGAHKPGNILWYYHPPRKTFVWGEVGKKYYYIDGKKQSSKYAMRDHSNLPGFTFGADQPRGRILGSKILVFSDGTGNSLEKAIDKIYRYIPEKNK